MTIHAEKSLREQEDVAALRDQLRSLCRIYAGLAHELGNPLTTALGYLGLLQQEGEALGEVERRRYYGCIRGACDRMVRMLEDLMTFSEVEEGCPVVLLRRPEDVNRIIMESVEHARFTLESHALRMDVEPGLPPVLMDRDRVLQVLDNLLSNATKYTPPGTHILVSACREDDTVKVTVGDAGSGVSAEQQSHLFDCFYRASHGSHGHGIGLFICRTLVEAHGGQMGVISAPDLGAAFWFSLPLESPAVPQRVRA